MLERVRDFFSTFLLVELRQGPDAHRPAPVRAQDHRAVPRGEDAAEPALPRPARAAPLSERRGALHRLQAVRGGVPGARDHDRVRAARRRHAPHDALRHRPHQVHLLRLLRGDLPGRLDRRDAHPRVPRREARRPVSTPSRCCSRSATATRTRSPRDRADATPTLPLTFAGMTFASRRLLSSSPRSWSSPALRVDHRAQPGARGAVARARVLHRRGALAAAAGRVPRDRAGARLRRRGDGAVPVRRDDARHQLRRGCARASGATCRSAAVVGARAWWSRWCSSSPAARSAFAEAPPAADPAARLQQHQGARPAALHRLRLPVRDRRGDPAGGDRRGHRADACASARRRSTRIRRGR